MATFYGNIRMRSTTGETVYADRVRDLPSLLEGQQIAAVHEFNHTLRKYKPLPSALRWVCQQRGQAVAEAPAGQPKNPQIAADFAEMRQLMDEMGYTPDERRKAVEGFVANSPITHTAPRYRGNASPITAARMAAGLTQSQLADRIGCRQKDISRWETGARSPSLPYALALSDALGVPVADLIHS